MNKLISNLKASLPVQNLYFWHLITLCAVVFNHALGFDALYRAFLYLNIVIVVYIYIKKPDGLYLSAIKS